MDDIIRGLREWVYCLVPTSVCLVIHFIILSFIIKFCDELSDFDKILKHQILIILHSIDLILQVLNQSHQDVGIGVPIIEAADPLHSLLECEHLGAEEPEGIDGLLGALLSLHLRVPVLVGARQDIYCICF